MAVLQRSQPESTVAAQPPAKSRQPAASTKSKPADHFPSATFTNALALPDGRRLPQTIAHRGFNAKYPENTLVGFQAAIDAGTHALETDTHVTKDGIVVLSHDPTLKRCFGLEQKIIDCDWAQIEPLRCLGENPQPMPRLVDVLEVLNEERNRHVWFMLDIKTDVDADMAMRLIAQTINNTPAAPGRPWQSRIVLGIWASRYLPLCHKYLPGYAVAHIGVSPLLSSTFFLVPNISHSLLIFTLAGPLASLIRKYARSKQRQLYSWTVNNEAYMRWCINRGLDGVITDDPLLFRRICKEVEVEGRNHQKEKFVWKEWRSYLFFNALLMVLWPWYMWSRRLGVGIDRKFIKIR